MTQSTLELIQKQYDPTWKSIKPDSIKLYEDAREQFQHKLKSFCDLLEISPPPQNVLDLACGSGIAAIELARQGYNVTGIDCSYEALEVAKTLEDHVGISAQWIQCDMRSFQLNEPMDYILLWDIVFGVFASAAEDSKVLDQISRALNVGGRCLIEFYDKGFAIQHGIEDCYFYNQNEDMFVQGNENNDMPIKQIKLYSQEEWQAMLRQVQMKIVRVATARLPDDPLDGPARISYLVVEKHK